MEDLLAEPQLNVGSFGSGLDPELLRIVFGGARPKQTPEVALRVKIAQARANRQARKREIDLATMPYVQKEIVESEVAQTDIQAKIDEALNALKAPPPQQQSGFNEGEMYAAALGGLLSPDNLPTMLNSLQQISGARNEMEFENKLREYGMTRDSLVRTLTQLGQQLDRAQGNEDYWKKQEFGYMADSAKADADIEADYEAQMLGLDETLMRRQWKLEDDEREAQREAERARIKALAEAGEKEPKRIMDMTQEFRLWFAANYPSNSSITQEQADEINAEWSAYAEEHKLPEAMFPTVRPRVSPTAENADLAKDKFDFDRKVTFGKAKSKGELTGTIDDPQPNPDYGKTQVVKEKRSQISKLEGQIQTAKNKVKDVQAQKPVAPTRFAGEKDSEFAKRQAEYQDKVKEWGQKLDSAMRQEHELVDKKRRLASGKGVSYEEYTKPSPEIQEVLNALNRMLPGFGKGGTKPVSTPGKQPKKGKDGVWR